MTNKFIAFTKISLPFGWLGNMSKHPVLDWPTAEHYFQISRLPPDHPAALKLHNINNPMTAKSIVKKFEDDFMFPRCSEQDVELMRETVSLKLSGNPQLKNMLKETGDKTLIEDVTKRQRGTGMFWGAAMIDGEWIGENLLGKIWMEFREAL